MEDMKEYSKKYQDLKEKQRAISNYIDQHSTITWSACNIIEASMNLTPALAPDIEKVLMSFIKATPLDLRTATEYVERIGDGWIYNCHPVPRVPKE